MRADAPVHRRLPVVQRRAQARTTPLDPTAQALGLFLVGRIAEHHGDRFMALDVVGLPTGFRHARHVGRYPGGLFVRVGQSVGDEQAQISAQRLLKLVRRAAVALAQGDQFDQFGQHPKLRHRERSELQLETDQPIERRRDRGRHRAGALARLDGAPDALQHAQQEGAGADRRIDEADLRRRQPLRQVEPSRRAQRLVHQPHHGGDDLRRRVVRARSFTGAVVVLLQEQFVEIEPGFRLALAELIPIDHIQHRRQGLQRRVERVFLIHLFGQQPQRRSDQRVGLAQRSGRLLDAARQWNSAGPRHQQAERDRLGIAVSKFHIRRRRKQQLSPVLGEAGEARRPTRKLFGDFIAQQAAEAGGGLRELPGRARRQRVPAVERREQRQQFRRRRQRLAGGLDITVQGHDRHRKLAVPPQAEGVAVSVNQVGQRLELLPLRLVVFVLEPGRVGALARRFHFDEADQCGLAGDCEVRADHQVGQPCLADQFGVMTCEAG